MGKETPQVWHHYDTDGGGYRRLRDMTASELAARDARQKAYETMLCRQNSFEKSREVAFQEKSQTLAGCVFAKSCKLPDSIIDYSSPSGFVPTEIVGEYGELSLLGGRRVDAGDRLPLQKISGVLPVGIGSLALGGAAIASAPVSGATTVAGLATAGVAGGALVGLVALLAPSSLGDGALYTDEQLGWIRKVEFMSGTTCTERLSNTPGKVNILASSTRKPEKDYRMQTRKGVLRNEAFCQSVL